MVSNMIFGVLFLCIGYCLAHPVEEEHVLMENPDLFGGDMSGFEGQEDRNAIVSESMLWPGGVIPYVKDPGLKDTVHDWILQRVFDHYAKFTCIKFVPRTTEEDYIRIFPGKGCYANVGKTGGAQPVSIGLFCGWDGIIIHELGHAVGFYHEQNRSDRDKFIRILWENVKEGAEDQFVLLKPHQNQLLTTFDYKSIMLYGSYTFSKDRKAKLRTMEGIDGSFLDDPMTKGKLSDMDIERIKKLYKCV